MTGSSPNLIRGPKPAISCNKVGKNSRFRNPRPDRGIGESPARERQSFPWRDENPLSARSDPKSWPAARTSGWSAGGDGRLADQASLRSHPSMVRTQANRWSTMVASTANRSTRLSQPPTKSRARTKNATMSQRNSVPPYRATYTLQGPCPPESRVSDSSQTTNSQFRAEPHGAKCPPTAKAVLRFGITPRSCQASA